MRSKYLEYHSSIRTENTLNSLTLKSRTKSTELNHSWTIKTDNKQHSHWMVWMFPKKVNCDRPIFARVKYHCDYGIDNCNPVLLMLVHEASVEHAAEFYFLLAGSLMAIWRVIQLPSTLCGLMPNLQNNTSQIPQLQWKCHENSQGSMGSYLALKGRVMWWGQEKMLRWGRGKALLSNSEIYIPRNALAPASLPNLKYKFPKQK